MGLEDIVYPKVDRTWRSLGTAASIPIPGSAGDCRTRVITRLNQLRMKVNAAPNGDAAYGFMRTPYAAERCWSVSRREIQFASIRRVAIHQSSTELISPPARVINRANSRIEIESLMNRTDPSPSENCAPPVWNEYASAVPSVP